MEIYQKGELYNLLKAFLESGSSSNNAIEFKNKLDNIVIVYKENFVD